MGKGGERNKNFEIEKLGRKLSRGIDLHLDLTLNGFHLSNAWRYISKKCKDMYVPQGTLRCLGKLLIAMLYYNCIKSEPKAKCFIRNLNLVPNENSMTNLTLAAKQL